MLWATYEVGSGPNSSMDAVTLHHVSAWTVQMSVKCHDVKSCPGLARRKHTSPGMGVALGV